MASPLFGGYQPGAISSFLASVNKAGAGNDEQSKKKPAKLQSKEASSTLAPTNTATARLFDEAVRAKFVPQQPLPGLAVPLLKRSRDGEDGEPTKKKTKKGKERPPRPLKSEKEAARGGLVLAVPPPAAPSSAPAPQQQQQQPPSPPKEQGSQAAAAASSNGANAQKRQKKQRKKEKQQPQQPPSLTTEEKREEPAAAAATASSDEEQPDARRDADEEKERRTVFVGNLPKTFTKPRLCALFKEFGVIESVRFRSMALAGTKVGEHGNQRLVKKVSANKRLLSEAKDAFNAYVVFASETGAERALAANQRLVEGKHLRVDRVGGAATRDPGRTVFVGNVAFDASEEEVRAHFAAALAAEGGDAAIEGVRLVRDAETQVGKGFGFVLLQDKATAAAALRLLHDSKFKGRPLRVTTCGKRARKKDSKRAADPQVMKKPRMRPRKSSTETSSRGASSGGAGGGGGKSQQRTGQQPASFEGRRASVAVAVQKKSGARSAGIRLKKRTGAVPGAKGKGKKGGNKGKKGGGGPVSKAKKGRK